MTIYLVDGKPCISVSNGFKQIDEHLYYELIEYGEIAIMEVIEHD